MVFSEQDTLERICRSGVIAVVVIDRVEDAVPLGRALLEGGIDLIELTLRTPAALDAATQIVTALPELLVGIGTILTPEQVTEACQAGAAFGVSPGLNPQVVERAQQEAFFFMPGVFTPSDVERAVNLGLRTLKYFPAEPGGGVRYLKSLAAPYSHLGLRYIPLGGLTVENMKDYLQEKDVLGVGGSWIAPRPRILDRNWAAVSRACREARRVVESLRPIRSGFGGLLDD